MRSKLWEWIGFGLAGLAFLILAGEFARHGLTDTAIVMGVSACFWAGLGGFQRHQRMLAEFRQRYPGWRDGAG